MIRSSWLTGESCRGGSEPELDRFGTFGRVFGESFECFEVSPVGELPVSYHGFVTSPSGTLRSGGCCSYFVPLRQVLPFLRSLKTKQPLIFDESTGRVARGEQVTDRQIAHR